VCLYSGKPSLVPQASAASGTYQTEKRPPHSASGSVSGRRAVKSLLEMRQGRTVVQQWALSCGAAALATLLSYQHGDFVSEREIAKGLMRRKEYIAQPKVVQIRQGFSLLDLKRYVDQRGYSGVGY